MAINIFVTYDLIKTKDYLAVHTAIRALGTWAKVTESNWYVRTQYDLETCFNHVRKSLDADDKLILVDATNNSARWNNIDPVEAKKIVDNWQK
ncbi:hypothetical protein MHZ90_19640 [Pantoea sp. ACRSH]|uniref:hypothetical protein n=1 Tax=unclassified Pantoea TaxID=2630326 RepID=UPI001EF6D24F|nr:MULTISPECIES: hypothetical protein [unclassified Pantoea]MCG7368316.1 hypothetical protein [Pantoea sp. ACRSH]MCG7398675.1 hypothetical protein [Pantoea sp. ACRSC]